MSLFLLVDDSFYFFSSSFLFYSWETGERIIFKFLFIELMNICV
jgi:hypothetical protein